MTSVDILLVEDDDDFREILSQLLELSGLKVKATGSAEKALSLLTSLSPKVMITDHNLSGPIKGLELARQVRLRLPNLPIMAISGSANLDHLENSGFFCLVVEKSQGYPQILEEATRLAGL